MSTEKKPNCGPYALSVNVYCDDHTRVYVGDCDKLSHVGEQQDYPKVVSFDTEARCCDYLYFVCWSNDRGENGFLAEVSGAIKAMTGEKAWEVFPAGMDFDNKKGPNDDQIKALIRTANCGKKWYRPSVGQKNDASRKPFKSVVSGIDPSANFIWYNSGKDTRAGYPTAPHVPFAGFNHDEFLIFRYPVKGLFLKGCHNCKCAESCDCCDDCAGCNDQASRQEEILMNEAKTKAKLIAGQSSSSRYCKADLTKRACNPVDLPDLHPCFYLHYGDSPGDEIETHDTEVVYLTVCNRFTNIRYKELRVTSITIVPKAGGGDGLADKIKLVPDKFIQFGCLDGCACKSRELALIARDVIAGEYTINVSYCVDEIVIQDKSKATGSTSFDISIVKD